MKQFWETRETRVTTDLTKSKTQKENYYARHSRLTRISSRWWRRWTSRYASRWGSSSGWWRTRSRWSTATDTRSTPIESSGYASHGAIRSTDARRWCRWGSPANGNASGQCTGWTSGYAYAPRHASGYGS